MPVYVQGTEFKPDRINLPQSASDPAGSHELGDIYFNTTDKELKIYQNVDTVGMAFTTMYSGSGGSGYSFNDAAYSNFFTNSSSPINCSTSNVQGWTGPGGAGTNNNCHNTLDAFFDNDQGRIYGSYDTCHHWPWNNGGGTYSGSASWYQINGTRTNLNGHSASGCSSNARGITIAYLQDDTPVIVVTHSSDRKMYYFNYPNGTYLGYQAGSTGTNQPDSNYWSGVCFDGSRLLVTTRGGTNDRFVYAYDMPANTSAISSNSISTVAKWSISHVCMYGMVWGGGDRIYITNKDSNQEVTQFQLSGSGMSGTSTSVATYTLSGTTNYSLGMDYLNRKLIIGGYSNNKYRVYGE
tara:strand:- start:963 stop:2018 length:1056 start_codon:yes stop_codon:yes gene_type:complete